METTAFNLPLVDATWLKQRLNDDDLILLDATLPKAVNDNRQDGPPEKSIPGARFFDIKNVFSDTTATYPNTWPGELAFNEEAQKLGINNQSTLVVYDDHGIYSSARAWWMFKAMGHERVAVLNGGLPAWKQNGFILENKRRQPVSRGDFKGSFNPDYFKDYQEVLDHLNDSNEVVLDARAENRFKGLVEEPRKGLRSGHIPGSSSLPYTDLLDNGKMRDRSSLQRLMHAQVSVDKNLVISCGSGITACVLALGATIAGYKHIAVYDGSWTEWGSKLELPIEREDLT